MLWATPGFPSCGEVAAIDLWFTLRLLMPRAKVRITRTPLESDDDDDDIAVIASSNLPT